MDELIAPAKKLEISEINNAPTTGGLVKLNVGGTVFQTTKSTLTRFDGFFRTLLETDIPVAKDAYGCIFVDRDPKHFRLILNFMRDGDVDIPYTDRQEIKKEAQFYLLNDMMKLCDDAKPVETHAKSRLLKNFGEIVTAVENSTKKGVIVVWYGEGKGNDDRYNTRCNMDIFMNYSEKLDVYFIAYEALPDDINFSNCHVFNKATKKHETCSTRWLHDTVSRLVDNET